MSQTKEIKIFRLPSKALLSIFAVPFIVVMRILSPLLLIRLGRIDISKIGHTYRADWYLSKCYTATSNKPTYDFFYFYSNAHVVCNRQWMKMWGRTLPILPFWKFALAIDVLQRMIPGYKSHVIHMPDIKLRSKEPHTAMNKF